MFEELIVDQNKHWEKKEVFSGVIRENFDKFISFISSKHIVSITGVRRCGKSTLLKQTINYLITKKKINPKNILFINLEHPYLDKYRKSPEYLEKILEDYLKIINPKGKIYLLFDEIQFFDNWQVFVKSNYELNNYKFVITGSNSRLLSSEMITLLSGRMLEFNLYPFSFREILIFNGFETADKRAIISNRIAIRRMFDKYSLLGGFPEVVISKKEDINREILQTYVKNIIYQDIIPRFGIKKAKDIDALFYYIISNVSKPHSYNSLSKALNISDKTIKEYLRYFEDAFLLFELEKFSFSVKKQINSPKKYYCIDTGFINAASFKISGDRGRLLENIVFLDLKKNNKSLYYYNDKKECDFIIKEGSRVTMAIQVADNIKEKDTRDREIRGLKDAMNILKLKVGFILTYEDEEEILEDGLKIIVKPIWKWLLGV